MAALLILCVAKYMVGAKAKTPIIRSATARLILYMCCDVLILGFFPNMYKAIVLTAIIARVDTK